MDRSGMSLVNINQVRAELSCHANELWWFNKSACEFSGSGSNMGKDRFFELWWSSCV